MPETAIAFEGSQSSSTAMIDKTVSTKRSDDEQVRALMDNDWVKTSDQQNPAALDLASQIIRDNIYCTLSTCSPDSWPWASPVFFTYDSALNFYWSSAIAAKHSQNIYRNQGRVAITIYGTYLGEGKGKGIYLSGLAQELDPAQVNTVMQSLFKRAGGAPPRRTQDDYLGSSPRRIYSFQPQAAWVTGERLALGNQLIDIKVQLDLASLIATVDA